MNVCMDSDPELMNAIPLPTSKGAEVLEAVSRAREIDMTQNL